MAKNKSKRNSRNRRRIPAKQNKQPSGFRDRNQYTSFKINDFRLFSEIEFTNLGNVNLIFGPNNCGKTSLIEAIFAHACGFNFIPFNFQLIARRQEQGLSGYFDYGDKILSLFKNTNKAPLNFSIEAKISSAKEIYKLDFTFFPSYELSELNPLMVGQSDGVLSNLDNLVEFDELKFSPNQTFGTNHRPAPTAITLGKLRIKLNEKKRDIEIQYPPNFVGMPTIAPFMGAKFNDILTHRQINSDIKIFSHLKRYGKLEEFSNEMRKAFPQVNLIDHIPFPDGKSGAIYIENSDNRKIPLHSFGDGMRRWFHILGEMIVHKNSVHCIEEIDATFHPSVLPNLSRLLIEYANNFKNQLFLTSHSIEFADAFLNALYGDSGTISESEEDPVKVFTIRPNGKDFDIWPLTGRDAFEKRQKYELELRY